MNFVMLILGLGAMWVSIIFKDKMSESEGIKVYLTGQIWLVGSIIVGYLN